MSRARTTMLSMLACLVTMHWTGSALAQESQDQEPPSTSPIGEGFPPLSDLGETARRPLFTPGRRPAALEPDNQRVERRPFNFSLVGIVEHRADRFAVVIGGTSGDPAQLRVGERLDGWTLAEISAGSARFERGGDSRTLELFAPGRLTSPRTPTTAEGLPLETMPSLLTDRSDPLAPAAQTAPLESNPAIPGSTDQRGQLPRPIGGNLPEGVGGRPR